MTAPEKTWGGESSSKGDIGWRWIDEGTVGSAIDMGKTEVSAGPQGTHGSLDFLNRGWGAVHTLSLVIGKAVIRPRAWPGELSLLPGPLSCWGSRRVLVHTLCRKPVQVQIRVCVQSALFQGSVGHP